MYNFPSNQEMSTENTNKLIAFNWIFNINTQLTQRAEVKNSQTKNYSDFRNIFFY